MTEPGPGPAEHVAAAPVAAAPHPLLGIWRHPRRTIRALVDGGSTWPVIVLACLGGIGRVLDRLSSRNAGDEAPVEWIVTACLLIGPVIGLAAVWLIGGLLRVIGRWHGRSAPSRDLRLALAWANVPAVAGLVLWIPLLAMLGKEMFTAEMPTADESAFVAFALLAIGGLQIALGVWGLVIACNGVAEVQGLRSAWMGLLHLVAAVFLFVGPLFLLVITVVLVS